MRGNFRWMFQGDDIELSELLPVDVKMGLVADGEVDGCNAALCSAAESNQGDV